MKMSQRNQPNYSPQNCIFRRVNGAYLLQVKRRLEFSEAENGNVYRTATGKAYVALNTPSRRTSIIFQPEDILEILECIGTCYFAPKIYKGKIFELIGNKMLKISVGKVSISIP